jgi:anti-anti-sigma regulatory factor
MAHVGPEWPGLIAICVDADEWSLEMIGEFDEFTVRPLRQIADQLSVLGRCDVVVDASRVTFASARLLTELLRLRAVVDARGGTLRFAEVSTCLRRVLEVTDLEVVFGIVAHATRGDQRASARVISMLRPRPRLLGPAGHRARMHNQADHVGG